MARQLSREQITGFIDLAFESVAKSNVGPVVKPFRNGHPITPEYAQQLKQEGKAELVEMTLDNGAFAVFLHVLDAILPRTMRYEEPREPWQAPE